MKTITALANCPSGYSVEETRAWGIGVREGLFLAARLMDQASDGDQTVGNALRKAGADLRLEAEDGS